ncbi:hypothetical protein SDC9_157147 [bioreactor metagenome]|uniref:Uncharacterized protein n=1 Tax=bioreactor metagenome TaxID=1076179 RepID=A0A645FBC1_9ZZZZ
MKRVEALSRTHAPMPGSVPARLISLICDERLSELPLLLSGISAPIGFKSEKSRYGSAFIEWTRDGALLDTAAARSYFASVDLFSKLNSMKKHITEAMMRPARNERAGRTISFECPLVSEGYPFLKSSDISLLYSDKRDLRSSFTLISSILLS